MNAQHVPFSIGGLQVSPETLLPISIAIIVGVILMFGVRREFATFAIAAGVIGALLVR